MVLKIFVEEIFSGENAPLINIYTSLKRKNLSKISYVKLAADSANIIFSSHVPFSRYWEVKIRKSPISYYSRIATGGVWRIAALCERDIATLQICLTHFPQVSESQYVTQKLK